MKIIVAIIAAFLTICLIYPIRVDGKSQSFSDWWNTEGLLIGMMIGSLYVLIVAD
jgi:hypothetical protein